MEEIISLYTFWFLFSTIINYTYSLIWKTFIIITIFLYCHPCLSTGSKIYIYKIGGEIKGGGGQSLGDMSPKKYCLHPLSLVR